MAAGARAIVEVRFSATLIEWRGPSPHVFAPIPAEHTEDIRRAAKIASYGWGVVPVEVQIGKSVFTTSLFPRDGGYLLPVKASARRAANVTIGDTVAVTMSVVRVR